MKGKMLRYFALVVLCVFVVLTVMPSCSQLFGGDGIGQNDSGISSLALSKTSLSMKAGAMEYLKITVTPENKQRDIKLEWTYDHSVISVDTSSVWGVTVSALKEGVTSLRCSADGYDATCVITVSGVADNYEESVEPYIYSNTQVLTLKPGGSERINMALYGGSNADLNGYTWVAEDPSVCAVTPTGQYCQITALETGYTRIKVTHVKAAYPYYVGVYVFDDPEKVTYITTDDNIVTMRPEDGEKRLSVRLVNGGEDAQDSGFKWQLFRNDGSDPGYPVSLASNGNNAVVTPESSGSCTLRVTHPDAAYPLDILVRVITIVKNVYIKPSASVVTLSGNTVQTLSFTLENISGIYDTNGFEYLFDNLDVAEVVSSMNGQVILRGKKNGSCKLIVSHEKAEYPCEVLVISERQTADAVDASRYITTSDNYVRTKIGAEPTAVNIALKGGTDGDERDFIWSVKNTADDGSSSQVIRLETTHGSVNTRAAVLSYAYGKAFITPLKEGTAVITVTHPKIVYPTEILVKVLGRTAVLEEPLYFSGNGLVKILNGESTDYTVYLNGKNKQVSDDSRIKWSCDKSAVRVTGSANTANIAAPPQGSGETTATVTVSHEKADNDKKIIVMTADDQESLDAMKCLYSDKNHFNLQIGETTDVFLSHAGFYGGYDEATEQELEYDFSTLKWSVKDPSVAVAARAADNPLHCQLSGVKSGTTTLTASITDSGKMYSCEFSVTVYPKGAVQTEKEFYFTTNTNVVNLKGEGISESISVTAVNLPASRQGEINWGSGNDSVVSVTGNGTWGTLTARGEGETVVTVSHPESQNSLKIYVRVGSKYVIPDSDPVVYISAPDVITMLRGDTAKTLNASLVNSDAPDTPGFSFSIDNRSVATIENSSPQGIAYIKPVGSGQAEITISHPDAVSEKKVLVVVGNSAEELAGITYLTTSANVVAVGEGASKKVSVSVVNSESPVLSGYSWASSDPGIIDIVSMTGGTALLKGNSIGTAKITVKNSSCEYPLEIIAQCVDPIAAAENPYIQLSSAVTVINVGSGYKTITADLVGGYESDKSGFTWMSNNSSICTVAGEREVGMIKALKAGQTYITVSHPKADISAQVLVVCEEVKQSECYISVPAKIISMKPTDPRQTITASLVNGSETDKYNFKWSLDVYDVIDLTYSDNVCSIVPKQQGTATITVSHPKAAYDTQISVTVEEYSDFGFPASYTTMKQGNVKFLTMQIPVTNMSTYVEYSVDDPGICSITGTKNTAQLTAVKQGSTIVRARLLSTGNGSLQSEAEMMVYVDEADVDAVYISSSSTIHTINKGKQQTISAILSGTGVTVTDQNNLKWSTTDPDIVRLIGVDGDGFVRGQQIMVEALKSGEALIVCSHEKAQSDLQFYVLVPGTAEKTVRLNKSFITTKKGASGTQLKATIENLESNEEYNGLVWSVSGADGVEICRLSPSKGQTVNVIPLNPGEGEITVQHPESGSIARCGITVEWDQRFEFELSSAMVQPFFTRTVKYQVSPPDAVMSWKADQMQEYFSYRDLGCDGNGEGTLEITGIKEGSGTLIGNIGMTGAHDSLSVVVDWNYSFSVNKTKIQGPPNQTYTVDISFSPEHAKFKVSDTDIADINVENLGDGKGRITITPLKEGKDTIQIDACNPSLSDQIFAGETVALDFRYDSLTLLPSVVAKNGSFSRWDENSGVLVVGDGETVELMFSVAEEKAEYSVSGITLQKADAASPIKLLAGTADNSRRIQHPSDRIDRVYKVTHDTYYTWNGSRIKLQWQYINAPEGQGSKDADIYLAYLGRGKNTSAFGLGSEADYYLTHWKNEPPYVVAAAAGSLPKSNEDEVGTRVANPPELAFVSAPLASPLYVTAGEFRNNTDWFIPSFPYNLVDRNGHYDWGWKETTYHRGNSPEYAINPAGTVATPDKTVLGYGYTDVLTVKIEHNGKTETHRINVYTETRGCAYNQQ